MAGVDYVGGLAGYDFNGNLTLSNIVMSGTVSGTTYVGGIMGRQRGGSVAYAASAMTVTASSTPKGSLIGEVDWWPSLSKSVAYDHNSLSIVGGSNSCGGCPGNPVAHVTLETLTNLKTTANYTTDDSRDWDLTTTWGISSGNTFPWLK